MSLLQRVGALGKEIGLDKSTLAAFAEDCQAIEELNDDLRSKLQLFQSCGLPLPNYVQVLHVFLPPMLCFVCVTHHHLCTPKGVPVLKAHMAFLLNSEEADWKKLDKGLARYSCKLHSLFFFF